LEFVTGSIKSTLAFTPEVMQSYSGILNNAPGVGFVNLLPGNSINNGLGGAQGFGEDQLPGQDDGFLQVDVSAVFQDDFRYFSNTWNAASEFFIGYNGYVTFGTGSGAYDPSGIAGSDTPMVAAHYTDVNTDLSPIAFNPAGNSTGTNKIYYDIDPGTDVVTVTFDDVRDYDESATTANAYQIRLWDLGGGDFGIELRYEDLVWGQSGTSGYGTAGWTAGDQTNYSELPGSGTSAIENIESESNIGQPGVFFWQVKDGLVFPGLPLQPPGVVAIDVNDTDPPGVSVSDPAFTEVLSDLDGDPLGIAVVAVDNTNGTWQYSTDGGTTWTDFGNPSDSNARLLAGTANNQIRFVPNLNYEGNAGNVLFRAWDQTSGTDGGEADTSTNGGATAFSSRTLPATLNVVAINDQPSFTATNPAAVNEDAGAQTVAGWATFNPGGPANEAAQTATYTVSNISNVALFATAPAVDANGNLTYSPADNAFGTSTFDVAVQDSGGTANGGMDTSTTQTFTITVNSVNDQPSLTASNPAAVNEDAGAQTVASWATFNPGGGTDEAAQTATYTVSNISNAALFATAPAVDANGQLTYTPAANVSGTSTFDVAVQDSGGTANGGVDTSATQTFTITVNAVNDQPSFTNAGNQTLTAWTNTAQTVANWANTFNFGANETGQAVADFIVSITSGNTLFTSLPDVANDGTLTYTPNGTPGTATISVQLQDDGGTANGGVDTSAAATFDITIPAPTVNLSVDSATGTEAGTTAITVTATAAGPVSGNQTVDLALTGTASAADFTGTIPTQITIADGASTGQVTLTVADDQLDENDETANLTISNPSAGIQLGTTTSSSVTITDDDTAGFDIQPISGNTSEAGGQATFNIRLNSEPTADVAIGLTSSNTAEGTVAPATVTFNSTNWNTYQTVTITGVDDGAVIDGDIAYQIITAADTTTADTNYNNLDPADVTVTNTDNDTPGVTVTQSAGSTELTEGSTTDTYTVQLNTMPTGNVEVTVTADAQAEVSLDGTTFAATQTLTFTNPPTA
jgi:hypothetical protein